MKVLHLLSVATIGGIEVLCRDMAKDNSDQNVFAILFKGGPIEQEIRDTGSHCYAMYDIPKWNILKRIKALLALCREEKIDIVVIHHEGLSVMVYYMLLQKYMPNIKYVRYLHSVFEEKYYYTYGNVLNNIAKKMMTAMYLRSDKLIAVSECVKNSFLTAFPIEEQKIQVVYNGISLETLDNNRKGYMSRKIAKSPDECINIIYMGRLEKVKGIDVLIEALSMLQKEQLNMKLFLLGDGSAREELEEQVRNRGLNQTVSFEGFQLQKEKYLQNADIFVYPSRWKEAFGISIIEAMACGIICIASKTGGIPEIIRDEENGYLFENENVLGLKTRLTEAQLLIREGKQDIMAQNAMKTAGNFTIDKTITQLNELFTSLLISNQELCGVVKS